MADIEIPDEARAAFVPLLNAIADQQHEHLCNCGAYPDGCVSEASYTRESLVAGLYNAESGLEEAWRQGWRPVLADRDTETERLRVENEQLKAKLDKPCGECHPCVNWSDETWRRADRKPPHVHEYDALRAEVEDLRAKLDAAYQHIGEEALIDMQEPIPPYGSPEREARRASLRGEA